MTFDEFWAFEGDDWFHLELTQSGNDISCGVGKVNWNGIWVFASQAWWSICFVGVLGEEVCSIKELIVWVSNYFGVGLLWVKSCDFEF